MFKKLKEFIKDWFDLNVIEDAEITEKDIEKDLHIERDLNNPIYDGEATTSYHINNSK